MLGVGPLLDAHSNVSACLRSGFGSCDVVSRRAHLGIRIGHRRGMVQRHQYCRSCASRRSLGAGAMAFSSDGLHSALEHFHNFGQCPTARRNGFVALLGHFVSFLSSVVYLCQNYQSNRLLFSRHLVSHDLRGHATANRLFRRIRSPSRELAANFFLPVAGDFGPDDGQSVGCCADGHHLQTGHASLSSRFFGENRGAEYLRQDSLGWRLVGSYIY